MGTHRVLAVHTIDLQDNASVLLRDVVVCVSGPVFTQWCDMHTVTGSRCRLLSTAPCQLYNECASQRNDAVNACCIGATSVSTWRRGL